MKKSIFVASAVIIGGLLCGMFTMTHQFGNPGEAVMDGYFLESALRDRSALNIVTSLVFDYRGFDTLGEAAVLFTAICSIGALFREGRRKL
jgi:multisubunit Na+/H+ antiporter MnhB subunit